MKRLLFIGSIVALFLILIVVAIWHVASVRVVGYAKNQGGIELCIVQEPGDFLQTSVFIRQPGGRWGWFYYDHEDTYWRKAKVEIDESTQQMTIFRNGELDITFDWKKGW